MRIATIIIVMALCGWTALQGLGFVRMTAVPGTAALTLEAQLRDLPGDAVREREQVLTRLLAIRPGSSLDWLSLSAARNALLLPQNGIDSAFVLSGLTGPAEGAVMAERALLGVLLWDKGSADVHARTLTDLCGLTAFDPVRLRLIVTTRLDTVKTALRSGLEAQGCSPALLKTIGL